MNNSTPLVQWTFLQYKKSSSQKNAVSQSTPCFLNSCTQIGSKFLIYGGCDYHGEALSSTFLYDTMTYQWSSPKDESNFQEDFPGPRYGHSATLIDMHPPRVMIFGGIVGGGMFEFDAPDSLESPDKEEEDSIFNRPFMNSRKKGKKSSMNEAADDRVSNLHKSF